MNASQLKELMIQSLQQEMGGVKVYETALQCAVNPDLKKEWTGYLEQTRKHVDVMRALCTQLGIDPEESTPGRQVVAMLGDSLVQAMQTAAQAGDPAAAEIVACECVVLAETKDHADWELIGRCAREQGGEQSALKAAYDEVEDEEDEHLYHTKGWCRELWLKSLGLAAVLPPPEEVRKVTTAIGAAKAQAESLAHR
jgi:rubrerythrin